MHINEFPVSALMYNNNLDVALIKEAHSWIPHQMKPLLEMILEK